VVKKNLGLTFPTKKRINTEQVIDRMSALYIEENRIRDETNEGDE